MLKLKFTAYRAIDNREYCEQYLEGHVNVLRDYGITNITSNTNTWIDNPNVYCVVAREVATGEMVGGIRIQISDGITPLPVEQAVGYMDHSVIDKVKYYHENYGVGELCGLWNAKRVAGRNISVFLTRSAISIINQLDFTILVGICADYTLTMFRNVGFVIDDSVGTKGEFVYPNEHYRAKVLGILNAETLETANEFDRKRMISLREQPVQKFVEIGKEHEVEIDYHLKINE